MQRKSKSTKAYPKELRDKAAKLVNECGYTIEQVAEQLGCSKESVRRWKEATKTKVDPDTARRMEREESELKRLWLQKNPRRLVKTRSCLFVEHHPCRLQII